MLDKIILFSIRQKFIIGCMTLALIAWGLWSATQIPIDAVPDITNNQVQIITTCPTLAGQEVEQLVTYPIEQSIANLPDIEELRSISRFGLSVVTVVFKEKVDVYFARQLLFERLNEAKEHIPEEVGVPELAPVSTGLGEIYQYIIHPLKGSEDKYTAMELRTMQDWIVSRQLAGTPGIAEVNSFGGLVKQYEVAVEPNRLLAMDITIPEIFTALERNNENTGGAYIDKKPNAYFIRGVGLIHSFEDIRNIVVKSNPNGIPIRISDVAEVRFGHAVRYGALTYNGESDVVGGVVMMLKGANSAEVVARVKEKMKTIQKSLPDDVVIEPYLDRTDLVRRAIRTVEKNLIEGALIVIFVLVLFLGNLRAGLIVASAIPLSMLFALGMMHVFGVSANLMSLGAIDFGLIVDGAVIIVESVFHRLRTTAIGNHTLTKDEMNETVSESARRMMGSAVFGQIIILIVYLPILSLAGIEGKMFKPMAQTVSFAILGALLLSLTYIPMMSALFLSRKVNPGKNFSDRMIESFQRVYSPVLRKALQLKSIILILTLALFSFSVFLFTRLGAEFIPTLQEGDYAFHCILPQGTSLSQSIETSMQSLRLIRTFDEVKMVVGKTGTAEVPTDPMPPEASDMMIILKPIREWKEEKTYARLASEMMEKLETIPGVFFESNQPIQMRFNELMTGIRQDVAVKIFGEDLDTLLHYSEAVAPIVQQVKGTTTPMIERLEGLPQITVHYNRSQMAHYGIDIEEVNHIISTAFAGGKAGVVFENERRFDLVVRLEDNSRNSIEDLEHLYVPTADRHQVPLSQIADIRFEQGPAQISREDGKRRIVIGFNVQGRDVASVVKEIHQRLEQEVKLPEGYYFTYGGTFENLQAASSRLMIVVPIALALIFILLYFAFTSMSQAILIFTAIPMSAIGGVFALWIRDMPFSISAGVGFIALFGVAVLNGIVLVSTFNQILKERQMDIVECVMEGTRIRLRPVLMTATVASLGFLPMALSHGAGAEVQKPLATVVIGGLISATFLTLIVLPALYILFSKKIPTMVRMTSWLLLPLFFLFAERSQAQVSGNPNELAQRANTDPISMEEAISIALENNVRLKSTHSMIRSNELHAQSGFELPKTSLTFQYGQYNSIENDHALHLEQKFLLPGYYRAKTAWYKAETEASRLDYAITSLEIRFEVERLFEQLIYLDISRQQLEMLDSVYGDFVSAASLRYSSGETNLLEKTTAEVRRGQITLALKKNQAERRGTFAMLKGVMQVEEDFQIKPPGEYTTELRLPYADSMTLNQHPAIRRQEQVALILQKERNFERSTLLPEFSLGYFNQSIIGTQSVDGQDTYFDAGKRFQGVSISIEVPLTASRSKYKLKALDTEKQSAELQAGYLKSNAKAQLHQYIERYDGLLAEYAYYNETGLPHAAIILKSSRLAYDQGEINYLEYAAAIQSATDIQLEAVQVIHELRQLDIEIRFLTQQ